MAERQISIFMTGQTIEGEGEMWQSCFYLTD